MDLGTPISEALAAHTRSESLPLDLVVPYWIVALGMSIAYGKWATYALLTAAQRSEHSESWWWHQRWLNFLGSLAGWLVLWPIVVKFGACLWMDCARSGVTFTWLDAGATLIAFVGVTGYLPTAIAGIVFSVAAVGNAVAKWIAEKTGAV